MTIAEVVWIGVCTVKGEGVTVDALRYNRDAELLIKSIVNENYEEAAKYLAFSGEKDKETAREQWINNMYNLDIKVIEEEHSPLKADNGRVETIVLMTLEDDYYIHFTIGVQNGGFGIRNIWASYKGAALDDECIEKISSAMKCWDAG